MYLMRCKIDVTGVKDYIVIRIGDTLSKQSRCREACTHQASWGCVRGRGSSKLNIPSRTSSSLCSWWFCWFMMVAADIWQNSMRYDQGAGRCTVLRYNPTTVFRDGRLMMLCAAFVDFATLPRRPQRQLSRLSRCNCCRSCQNPRFQNRTRNQGRGIAGITRKWAAFSPYAVDAMQALTVQRPGAGQLSTFGTPYIIQQLQSNPQVTRQAAMVVLFVRRKPMLRSTQTVLQGALN